MDRSLLKSIKVQVEAVLGNQTDPEYTLRYAAFCAVTDHHKNMLALSTASERPWHTEQAASALQLLTPQPDRIRRAREVAAAYIAELAVGGSIHPTHDALKDIVNWAAFEDRSIEDGLAAINRLKVIAGQEAWPMINALLGMGLYRLKRLMPSICIDPFFSSYKADISTLLYHSDPHYLTIYPDMRAIEEPLIGDPGLIAPSASEKKRVGIWSGKMAKLASSMTAVHPWLMNPLISTTMNIYILSEKRYPDDPVQKIYRKLYGDGFIDCDDLDDETFVEKVRGLGLDVIIPLHMFRPAVAKQRLARCHLDVWADMGTVGIPDRSLVSEGMIDPAFIEKTGRNFIVIPDPPYVYSRPPEVELKEPDSNTPFCFGAFNRILKYHDEVLDVWGQILRECPKSTLLFANLSAGDTATFIVQSELGRRGVDPSRVIPGPLMGTLKHLDRHNQTDLMLDTFPLAGGMTAVDAFYMGVPLVSYNVDPRTCVQQTRAFFTLLGPEAGLSARSVEEYIDYAKARYAEGKRTKAQREHLRAITAQSPLFDQDRYARLIQAAVDVAAGPYTAKMVHISYDHKVTT